MKNIICLTIFILCLTPSFSQDGVYSFTLDEAINFAIENSYTTRTAALDIEAAEKKKWETTTIGLPQIDGTVSYQNNLKQVVTLLPAEIAGGNPGEYVPVTFGTKQSINTNARLNQLIFDGSYIVGLQSAKTYLTISNLAKEKTDQGVREAVINAYGNVLINEETIDILNKNIAVLEKNLSETKAILQNGLTEEQDVEQQQITLLRLKNELNKTKRYDVIAKKMLNITLGIPVEEQVILEDKLEAIAIKSADMQLLSKQFNLKNHIDYKIADNTRESDALLVKFEKSKYLPSLSGFIDYSYYVNADRDLFNDTWYDSSMFGLSLNVPIFSSLQRSARTQQAKINLIQSEIALNETSEKLKLQVETARNSYQFALDQFNTTKQNIVLAESIANKEQIKFFEGISTSLDLTNAQNQLYSIQQEYLMSILEIIQTKVELENALNIFEN